MEVQKVLQSMKLRALHNNLAPTRTGGTPLTDNTLSSYEKHYDSLYFFFSHINDFESLLMLRREPLDESHQPHVTLQMEERGRGHSTIR
jgi:hypothetical protein